MTCTVGCAGCGAAAFEGEWNRAGKRKNNMNQAEGKEEVKNTWETRWEKQTKWEMQ